jgi:hypothetical protein
MAKQNDKKNKAKSLFLTGQYDQKEIAEIVCCSEKSVSKWKIEGDWESFKTSLLTTRENELRRLYKMLQNINDSIDEKSNQKIPINSKDADAVLKLTAAIRNLEIETSIADKVEIGTAFINFIRKDDNDKAKEITKLYEAFLTSQIK